MKSGKKLIAKLIRAPRVLNMLLKIEYAQLRTRGINGYFEFHAKAFRNRRSGKFPRALQIEPFGGCNLRCSMCFQGRMPLPSDKVMMPLETYKRIIDQVSPFTPTLYLYWRGEPLLHKDLGAMIRYAKERDMYVFVSTNAVTLTEAKSRELIHAGLDFLLIGFDGASQETYGQMRQGANFDTICAQIQALVRIKQQEHKFLPHVCLQFIVSKINKHELSKAQRLATKLGADSFLERSLDVQENYGDEVIDQALQPLYTDGSLSKYEKSENGLVYSGPIRCIMATRMVVRADGELNLCCYDIQGRYSLGSAHDRHVLELWNEPHYVMLRQQGQCRQLELCTNCGAGVQK